MPPKQPSITLISKDNGQLTGEKADALPITIVQTKTSVLTYLTIGFLACLILIYILTVMAKSSALVVETTGKAADYQEYQMK